MWKALAFPSRFVVLVQKGLTFKVKTMVWLSRSEGKADSPVLAKVYLNSRREELGKTPQAEDNKCAVVE